MAIFYEFCIMDGIGAERNDNFYFLSFSFFSTLFWLQKKPQRYFIIFWFSFVIFLEFSITLRVRTKQNDDFYFLFLSLVQPILAGNDAILVLRQFFDFFYYFFGIFYYARVGTERNNKFYFLSCSAFSSLFWLEMKS